MIVAVLGIMTGGTLALPSGIAGAKGGEEPYKVVAILSESESLGVKLPNVRAGIKAGVAKINKGGGLGDSGRPIEVEFCITDIPQENGAAECARDAVADPDVIATVAATAAFGEVVNPIFEEAGLASVAPLAVTFADMTSPIAFPVMGGFAAVLCQAPLLADEADAEGIGIFYPDSPGGEEVVPGVEELLSATGGEVTGSVPVAFDKTDVSSEVQAGTDGADGVVTFLTGEINQRLVRTLRQQAPAVDVAVTGLGNITSPDQLEKLGADANGLYVAAAFATDDMRGAGIKEYKKWIKKTGGAKDAEDATKNAYIGLDLLDFAAEGLETIDRTTILTALNNVTAYDSGGLAPVLNFTEPGEPPFVRIVNPTCVYAQVKDGKVKALQKEFIEPFAF